MFKIKIVKNIIKIYIIICYEKNNFYTKKLQYLHGKNSIIILNKNMEVCYERFYEL